MMLTRLPMVFPHGVMLLRAIIGPTRSRMAIGTAGGRSDLSCPMQARCLRYSGFHIANNSRGAVNRYVISAPPREIAALR